MTNVILTQLTIPEIRELLREELQTFFTNNEVNTVDSLPKNKIVDLSGLLKARPFIGTRSTIYKKVSRGEIPHSKNGKRLIFDLLAIDEWLLSNQIQSTDEINAQADEYLKNKGGYDE